MERITVAVVGALANGAETVRAIQGADDMELVGAVDLFSQGEVVADGKVKVEQDLAKMLAEKNLRLWLISPGSRRMPTLKLS